jgi:predicted CoA-substrate-specific enzyme activase
MIVAGIDAGSRALKIALVDRDTGELVASATVDQTIAQCQLAQQVLDATLAKHGHTRGDIVRTIATGYGRNLITFADGTITEITCHARGVRQVFPSVRTIVEIGGQDSKVIRLGPNGHVEDFAMNDRCAAGTGRFLELVGDRLNTKLLQLGEMALHSQGTTAISSMCAVFAETEIIGLLASGTPTPDIAAGVQNAIARRMAALAGRKVVAPVVFTGGVALVPGMDQALGQALGERVTVAPTPQMTGALGAALLGREQLNGSPGRT